MTATLEILHFFTTKENWFFFVRDLWKTGWFVTLYGAIIACCRSKWNSVQINSAQFWPTKYHLHYTYESQIFSPQTVSNKSIISDSGRGFPFKDGFLSSAFLSALLICIKEIPSCYYCWVKQCNCIKRGDLIQNCFFIVQSRMSLGISQINLPEFVWFVPRFIGSKCKMPRILIFCLSLIIVSDLWFYQSTDKEKILMKAERFLKDQRIHWPKSHLKYSHTATNKNRY